MEELHGKGYECLSKSRRNGIDLTNQNAINDLFKKIVLDFIINCAAYILVELRFLKKIKLNY